MNNMEMKLKNKYRFKYTEEEDLIYLGTRLYWNGEWHLFCKVGGGEVWCELRESDLDLIEEVV